jgi:hypothetical protein
MTEFNPSSSISWQDVDILQLKLQTVLVNVATRLDTSDARYPLGYSNQLRRQDIGHDAMPVALSFGCE